MAEPVVHFGDPAGGIAKKLLKYKGDVGGCRPWKDFKTGRSYLTLNVRTPTGGFVWDSHKKKWATQNIELRNAEATLGYDEWKVFDSALFRAFRQPLSAFSDLRASAQYKIAGGFRQSVLQYQRVTDAGNATLSMDGLRTAQRDRVHTDTQLFPLPIIHSDFSCSWRELEESRDGIIQFDTEMLEQSAHQCAVKLEGLTVGTESSFTYGGGTIYGYTNHPLRYTAVLTDPTGAGWVPDDTVNDVIAMRQTLIEALFPGPWVLYVSPKWDGVMQKDYSQAKGNNNLMDRLKGISGISKVSTLWYLTGYQMLLIKLGDPRVARAVTGMNPRIIEWGEQGDMQLNWKVIVQSLPQIRANTADLTGYVHGSTA